MNKFISLIKKYLPYTILMAGLIIFGTAYTYSLKKTNSGIDISHDETLTEKVDTKGSDVLNSETQISNTPVPTRVVTVTAKKAAPTLIISATPILTITPTVQPPTQTPVPSNTLTNTPTVSPTLTSVPAETSTPILTPTPYI